jgi:leucyl aminopeptidase
MTAITFTARRIADVAGASCQCAILPVFSRKKLAGEAQQLDAASGGSISAALSMGDIKGKAGETLMLPGAGASKRILLLGCGPSSKFDRTVARKVIGALYEALNATSAADATLHAGELPLSGNDVPWFYECLARALTTAAYRYTETISEPKPALKLARLVVDVGTGGTPKTAQRALDQGCHTGAGINLAKNLANLPGNICTPQYLADQARKLASANTKLSARILSEKQMADLGMGSLLSVTAGSDQPAKFIIMEYKGAGAKHKPYVLVGKGITFDSGGISLKPGAKMDEMKFDMGGAAGVFGTMHALCALKLPLNVVAIVAAAENMPSGGATKPGDVVTSMSGKTIEILNTDAEGRLVLCDALTYAERYKPRAVIDLATLTGACVVALGSHAAGLYANNDALAEQLLAAGTESHDRAWRMPLWDDYHRQLKSNFADLANIGGPEGGSITAACFLARFAEKYHWAHLDIAGAAWDSSPKGATGRPVALLTRYLIDQVG